MKKLLGLIVLLSAFTGFAELPILRTAFRKAPQQVLEARVSEGNAEAQLELALRYYAGHEVEKDAAKAIQLLAAASSKKHPMALFLLSRAAAEGIGMDADADKEAVLFAQAISLAPASSALTEQYAAYMADADRAAQIVTVCADAGYKPAVLTLQSGTAVALYDNGEYEDALMQLMELADSGSAESAWLAGRIYADGKSSIAVDEVEALNWFLMAAEGGYVPAQYEVAVRYENGIGIEADAEQAERWYRQAAERGHAGAQFRLGEIVFERAVAAESVAESDDADSSSRAAYRAALREAVRWYSAAAEQDDPDALFVMGRLSASGEGLVRNQQEAIRYYERAAALGRADAEFYLGLMYHAGLGVRQDVARAIEFYQSAADQGVSGALYYLANCYRFGQGVPAHPVRGEGIYYSKLLEQMKLGQEGAGVQPDHWMLAAAREYGLILWNRSGTMGRRIEASSWVGMAAQNGDEAAQELFREMNERNGRDEDRGTLAETRADPAADAVRKRRRVVFFPYVQQDLEMLYRKSDARQKIVGVDEGFGSSKNVMGDSLDGLSVVFVRPEVSRAVGFHGILLAGLEFVDEKTQERYWSFAAYQDDSVQYSSENACNLFVAVDTAACPGAELTGWAVVYGHLLPDGRTVAVFDTAESGTDSFADLFARNRFSTGLPVFTSASVDVEQLVYSVLGVEDEEGLTQSIIDRLDLTQLLSDLIN